MFALTLIASSTPKDSWKLDQGKRLLIFFIFLKDRIVKFEQVAIWIIQQLCNMDKIVMIMYATSQIKTRRELLIIIFSEEFFFPKTWTLISICYFFIKK